MVSHDAATRPPHSDAPLYRAAPHVMSCAFGEGTALLDGRTNTYSSLDPVGATVWAALAEAGPAGVRLDTLCAAVADEFDVSAPDCRDDVAALLDALVAHGLCESEVPSNAPAPAAAHVPEPV